MQRRKGQFASRNSEKSTTMDARLDFGNEEKEQDTLWVLCYSRFRSDSLIPYVISMWHNLLQFCIYQIILLFTCLLLWLDNGIPEFSLDFPFSNFAKLRASTVRIGGMLFVFFLRLWSCLFVSIRNSLVIPRVFCVSCTHCGTSSKTTPMMRRGPAGPRTLCNACGLFRVNKVTLFSAAAYPCFFHLCSLIQLDLNSFVFTISFCHQNNFRMTLPVCWCMILLMERISSLALSK